MQQQQSVFGLGLKLVAEELAKDSSKLEQVLPAAALRVEASQICLVQSAMRLAKKCKRGTKRLCTRDVERAMAMEFGESSLYFTSDTEKPLEAHAKSAAMPSIQVYHDVEVNLKDFVEASVESVPRIPLAPTYSVHWLAVDGIQPAIPENQIRVGDSAAASGTGPGKKLEGAAVMTRELQLYYDKTVQVLLEAETSITGNSEQSRRVLASLGGDAGIDRLVPHLVHFIRQRVDNLSKGKASSGVTTTTTTLAGLWTCMRVAHALLSNESLSNLELYLHELLPSLLTCVVGQSLCSSTLSASQDHWALRDFAAQVVALVCKKFAEQYAGLQPRVSKVFAQALELSGNALTSRYGGVVGLCQLGPLAVDSLLVPYLTCHPEFVAQLEQAMREGGGEDSSTEVEFVTKVEAFKVCHAIRIALQTATGMDSDKYLLLQELGCEQLHAASTQVEVLW
ncbi:hypothetical protein BASA81_002462 [Batrachochytrium salamandrivorans]|nr:hypothetical protein BASA81_002462 [Batrachochytrium salamandrivorans]